MTLSGCTKFQIRTLNNLEANCLVMKLSSLELELSCEHQLKRASSVLQTLKYEKLGITCSMTSKFLNRLKTTRTFACHTLYMRRSQSLIVTFT